MSQPRRRLLHTTLSIGPSRHPADQVKDAEAFCRHELDKAMRSKNMDLDSRPEDYEDSLQLLILQLWRLNETFETERNDCFADYARAIIRKRAYDVSVRRLLGRTGARRPDYEHTELDESNRAHRHEQALPVEPSDEDPDRRRTLGRLPDLADSRFARAAAVLGIRAAERAA